MAARSRNELERELQDQGYRLTPQRTMILDVIRESDDHVSAEQIYARVREVYPHVNISTVYRTLDLLSGLSLVTRTDLGEGRVLYHWAEKSDHHHLICQKCGDVALLDNDLLKPLKQTLYVRYGFHASLDHFALFGRCAKCSATTTEVVRATETDGEP
ncbi:MAG: transcriptional repressor [Chloroflexota bacterium]|nr:MAG: transcriptional repressor [Chloroflexota bacterium]